MRLNVVICSLFLWLSCATALFAYTPSNETDSTCTRYERLMTRRTERWQRLLPDHTKAQFAGSIGVGALSIGWTYGKKEQWETDIFIGFLPKFESESHKAVLTLKETYLPWRIRIAQSDWIIQPLTCSFFLSSILNNKFWTREPDRYPKGYYGFSTRIRANLSLGQRIMYDLPDVSDWWFQDVSLYYELGACDTDFCTFFGDRSIKFKEILSLSAGIKLHF